MNNSFINLTKEENINRINIDPRLVDSFKRVMYKIQEYFNANGYSTQRDYERYFEEYLLDSDFSIQLNDEPSKIGAAGFYIKSENRICIDIKYIDDEQLDSILCHEFIHFLVKHGLKFGECSTEIYKGKFINEALTEMIEEIFHENKGRYGARRIQMILERQGVKVNHKRVSKLMSANGLVAKGTRKTYRKVKKGTPYEEKENILNRVFAADARNKVWVGDITYIPTKHGFLYLAVFIDIFSRKVTGWSMDTRIRDTLVLSALNQAIGREHPDPGLIIHTDRGSQYTSQRFQALLTRGGFVQSMSRKGNPYDNAVMESF